MKKIFTLFALSVLFFTGIGAQTYQSTPDQMWGRYCFRERNGEAMDAYTNNSAMTTMPNSNEIVLAYYYRIPAGHVRADMVWRTKMTRQAKIYVKVSYPQTGEVLKENTITNTPSSTSETLTTDLFGDINFPADDFYRVELSSDDWSNISSINYFNYYHESTDPVMIPRNFGGTSAYLSTWGSTDPDAPSGQAYDWAYVELRCNKDRQYPRTYYMAIGTTQGYLGMQTTTWDNNAGDYSRNVLFSMWDAANGDEMIVPDHMQSCILDGNLQAVHTHAGGEGSSASVMFQNNPVWWKDDHWVQFLLNARPMTTPITLQGSNGQDSTFNYPYTVMTAWYKLDTMPEWRYMATMRVAGRAELLASWYDFIEPFTPYAGQKIHTVYHRHAAMRSANSGRWYNRNYITLGNESYGRDFHYDFGRGATQKYDNCFFMDMGGYIHQHDSATVVPLAQDMSFVDTINLDALNRRVDQALHRDDYYNLEHRIHLCAPAIAGSTWKVMYDYTTPAANNSSYGPDKLVDGDENTMYRTYTSPAYVAFRADEEQTISSFEIYWTNQYNYRCHFVDVYTSEDGQNWNLQFDSLEIRCLDHIDVSLPHPITTKYIRLQFYYKYTSSTSLYINELTFHGAYNLNYLKQLADTLIKASGTINNYSADDLKDVIAVYDNGNCTDAQALADALSAVSVNGTFARSYQVLQALSFASDHNYFLRNSSGYGVLSVDTLTGRLSLKGATVEGALPQFSAKAEVSDPQNNWLVLHDEKYTGYYLYNTSVNKFFNPTAAGYLSAEPYTLLIRSWGRAFYLASTDGRQVYSIDPTKEAFLSASTTSDDRSYFQIFDNMAAQTPNTVIDSIQTLTEPIGKLALYKEGIQQMLQAPVGVVGGFTSEEARQALQTAYDNANSDPEAFISAVEQADVIALDPEHSVYRLYSAEDTYAAAPYITSDASLRLNVKSEDKGADQIWRFVPKNDGYALTSQGVTIRPINESIGQTVTTTATAALGGTLALSESTWGKHYIGPCEYAPAVINAANSPLRTDVTTTVGSTWYIQQATTGSIAMNSAGVNSTYYDYGYILPAGLTAYAVDSVTPAGIIKLRQLSDTVPPRTGVILQGDAYQRYTLEIFGGSDTLSGRNLLRGVFFRNTSMEKGTFLTLATSGGKVVMRKPTLAVVNANQVYLPITDDMPALSSFALDFDDVIDGVSSAAAETDKADTPTYTIDGRRAYTTQKGNIYIRNHKKILVK